MRAANVGMPRLPDGSRALLLETLAQIETLVPSRDALASYNERLKDFRRTASRSDRLARNVASVGHARRRHPLVDLN